MKIKPLFTLNVFTSRLLLAVMLACYTTASSQVGEYDRGSARTMLATIKDDLRNNYYDPNLRGMNLEGRFQEAEEKVKKRLAHEINWSRS